ncbi:HAD family hydrolase [Neomegalonema perideroedes]|uniref:HAD family hydrolase n=1 Tax=Neomegalonema perideroedes TaxID=217219 RepID=UPI00035D78D2|nr:HAD family hydrolase [Neomegalonema perideroedes]
MTKISAIVFDAFGTLIEPPPRRIPPYEALARRIGRRELMKRNQPYGALAAELGLPPLAPEIRAEWAADLTRYRLFPEVAPLLEALRARGLKIGLCSNLAFEYGRVVRRLPPDLDARLLSYEVGAVKPEPEIYQAVCAALRIRPEEALFIGDSLKADVEGPRAFGMSAARIQRAGGRRLFDVLAEAGIPPERP